MIAANITASGPHLIAVPILVVIVEIGIVEFIVSIMVDMSSQFEYLSYEIFEYTQNFSELGLFQVVFH